MKKAGSFGLLVLITMVLVAIVALPVSSQAQIWAGDEQGNARTDFGPEENVYIRGSGFNPNAQINISITRPDNVVENYSTSSDENGCFLYIYTLDGLRGTYYVTATDGVTFENTTFDDSSTRLKTYKDPACTILGTVFYQCETVYAKATSLVSSRYYKFVWFNPLGDNVKVTIYENGAIFRTDNYPLPPDAPVGKWGGVKLFEGKSSSGPWTLKRTATFYVWHCIAPIADSWVELTNPNTDHGSDQTIHAKVVWDEGKGIATNLRRSYLKFDLSSIPPWMMITSAKLHLYRTTCEDNIPSVYSTTDNWTENGITWNNQPGPGALENNSGIASGSWIEWDITSYAASEFAVDNVLSVVLKFNPESGSDQHADFTSREGEWDERPWLEISVKPLGSISGAKWNDLSYNGIWDNGEPGLSGWTIQLYFFDPVENSWINIDNENTGAGGSYTFSGLAAGNYRVNEVLKTNWIQTFPASPGSYSIALSDGENREGINFGNVSAVYGVSVSISPTSQSGTNGATLTYTVTVSNTGNVSDTYSLTPTDTTGWSPSVSPTSLTVPAGENRTATLSVTISSGAVGGTIDNMTVTAISQTDNTVENSASCTAQVTVSRGVSVSISPTSQSGLNGTTLTYTVTVNNTSNVSDTYSLTVADNAGWLPSFSPTSLTLSPGSGGNATLSVTVPSNAIGSTIDNVTVTATGTGVSGLGNCTAQVTINRGVNISISPSSQSGANGATLTYTVTVSNTGNVSDTYSLTVADNAGWLPSVSPTSLILSPGSSGNATLSVTVPDNAINFSEDNMTVTATGTGVSGSGSCIAQVTTFRGVSVSISPSSQSGANGATLTYTVTVNNTGNVSDTYSLTATDSAGWSENVSPTSLTVSQFSSGTATLSVTIPSNAIGGTIDNITVTATGTGVSGSDSCTAQVTINRGVKVSISPSSQGDLNGAVLTYTVTVVNLGNVTDTYDLTISDNSGWNNIWLEDNTLRVGGFDNDNMTTLHVEIPDNAKPCTEDNIIVTAISRADNSVKNSDSCIAHAAVVRDIKVSISPALDNGLVKNVTITNMGNVVDNFSLTAEGNVNWRLMLAENLFGNVMPGENRVTTLRITIPSDTKLGTVGGITVTATSQIDPEVSGSGGAQVTAIRAVDVSISPKENWGSGETLVYVATIRNIGNTVDNYYITKTDELGWLVGGGFLWLYDVAPGSFASVNLEVTIPENVKLNMKDVITVTATSQVENTVFDNDNCVAFGSNFAAGWNLISFWQVSENDTPNNLFAVHPILHTMYYWTAPYGPYIEPPNNQPVKLGVGYWVYVNKPACIRTTGEPVENYSIDLVAGWNMVGFPVTSENTTPTNLFAGTTYTMYYWEAPYGPYVEAPNNAPVKLGVGYWVKVNQNTTATVPL